jgi:uncharacterized membrane protein
MRRWVTIALAVSVALNLFFLGVTAARFWQKSQWRARDDAALRAGGAAGARRPEGRRGGRRGRDALSWMTDAQRSELRPKRQALVGTRRDAEQVLSSEPFDAAKFRTALEALRTQTVQVQSSVHERLVEHAQSLGLEERRKLADLSWGTPGERQRSERRRE